MQFSSPAKGIRRMTTPRIGISLSGGTAKSVTHVGVIKALVEAGIPINCVAGTSGGSIVGSMYASGMPISTMEAVASTMSWSTRNRLSMPDLR